MRVAVVGAGVAGLVCALRLQEAGRVCDVYERWPGLGGQAATLEVGQGHRLERYYHHWFTSDRHIVELCEELGVAGAIGWHPSSMAFFVDGRSRAFTTPLDLLRFSPLKLRERLRMGLAVVRLQRSGRPVSDFEGETARTWIEREMGPAAYAKVWGPLLRGKFGSRADDISMAWLHGKLTQRRRLEGKEARKELLGYPEDSFEPLFTALEDRIVAGGGRVLIDRPVTALTQEEDGWTVRSGVEGSFRAGLDPAAFTPRSEGERYDTVVATVPNDIFLGLAGHALDADYRARLGAVEYHTALCLLLELDRSLSPFYWTNVADPALGFVGLVEHTNLVDPARYDGRRFLYVANYVEPGHPLLDLDADALLAAYAPGIAQVNPDFEQSWVRQRWRFVEPAGQPVVTVGYHRTIPPLATGVPGLFLANTTQIYPEDRGTNYAVRLGQDAARAVLGAEVPA
ncbi:MAG: FAD-dependent oxidoreductase [Solirubrobacterales bacterium]|nr:FAD-dependent oxidoreductase [Solirubrobacterales bacterium]